MKIFKKIDCGGSTSDYYDNIRKVGIVWAKKLKFAFETDHKHYVVTTSTLRKNKEGGNVSDGIVFPTEAYKFLKFFFDITEEEL